MEQFLLFKYQIKKHNIIIYVFFTGMSINIRTSILMTAIFLTACTKSPIEEKSRFDPIDKSVLSLDGWEFSKSVYDFRIDSRDIFFLNDEIGYVAGLRGEIYKTTDSGEIWTMQNSGTTLHLLSVFFLNENEGFASSQAMNCLDEDCNKGCVLLKTIDGGETWTKTFFPDYTSIYSLKFFDELSGIAIISTSNNSATQSYRIAITTDGGVNWIFNNVIKFSPNDKLVFVNDLIFVAGEDRRIYKSSDRGHTWAAINTPVNSAYEIREMYFYNENVAFIDGITDIYKTNDGGLSWFKINTPFHSIETFHFSDENEGFNIETVLAYEGGDWPVFKGSIFYKTADGGLTWTKSDLNPSLSLGLVNFPQRKLGFTIFGSTQYRIKRLE